MAGCLAACGGGMPGNMVRSPELRTLALATYVCEKDALVLVDRGRGPELLVAAAGWMAHQSYSEGAADHYVVFYLSDEGGRVAVDYVLPHDVATAAQVLVYDRSEGATYQTEIKQNGVWAVAGRPSSRRDCARAAEQPSPRLSAASW